jgi:hypothetical protein
MPTTAESFAPDAAAPLPGFEQAAAPKVSAAAMAVAAAARIDRPVMNVHPC